MITFVGEHTGKIDAKGRVPLPSQLFRQLGETDGPVHFVLKKSVFKDCLELHPYETWKAMAERLNKEMNPILNPMHNKFLSQFNRGTVELTLDATNRLLIPKELLAKVGMTKEVVFLGVESIIEIWDKSKFEASELSQEDFEKLAGQIFTDNFNIHE